MKLRNDKIHIFGGGSGIGKAIAKRFCEAGAKVVITGRTEEKLAADYADLTRLTSELSGIYTSIQSGEQAEAAVEALLPLLVRYLATAGTRHFSTPEQQETLLQRFGKQLNLVYSVLLEQRKRVREANYYDSVKLRIVDYLLD